MFVDSCVFTAKSAKHAAAYDASVPSSDIAAQGRRLAEKFDSLAAPALGAAEAAALRGAIAGLDAAPGIAGLVALCAPR